MATRLRHRRIAKSKSGGRDIRVRLLDTAVQIFGHHGFEAASTRMLAEAADANLQAIAYYFGDKEGLYLAVADHIADGITALVGPIAARIRERVEAVADGRTLPVEEARALLKELLQTIADVMIREESAAWARVIVREQMEPTQAFERIYKRVMAPLLDAGCGLVAMLLRQNPKSESVRLRMVELVGQVLVYRVAHTAVMRQLHWQKIGAREFGAISDAIDQAVACIVPSASTKIATKSGNVTR